MMCDFMERKKEKYDDKKKWKAASNLLREAIFETYASANEKTLTPDIKGFKGTTSSFAEALNDKFQYLLVHPQQDSL